MRVLSLAIAMLFAICVNGQQVKKSLTASNGTRIGFYEFRPANYGKVSKQPLIIFLHGVGERGNGGSDLPRVAKVGIAKLIAKGSNMTFSYKGKTESFVVLSPQLSTRYGNWQPFYVEELIAYARKNLDIDANRIFVTGLSLGGGGVWRFATNSSQNASRVAAILPICGTCAMANPGYIKQFDVKVWAFHARDDRRVGIGCTNSAIDRINSLNPKTKAKKTIFSSGGHTIWNRVYNPSNKFDGLNVYQWFLSIKPSASSSTPDAPTPTPAEPAPKPSSSATNEAPKAAVKDSYIVISEPASTTVLNGSPSSDKDGKIVRYEWSQIDGESAHISYTKMPRTNVSDLKEGIYKFQLEVTDNDGATAREFVTVKVLQNNNAAPRAVVSDNSIIVRYPESRALLNGSSSSDEDGRIVRYEWKKIEGPSVHISYTKMPKTNISRLVRGTYRFELTVTDNDGKTDKSYVTVKVIR